MTALNTWYAEERQAIRSQPAPIMLGGVVYGEWYLDVLEQCCLPSLMAPKNLEALSDCRAEIMFYTDHESMSRLVGILDRCIVEHGLEARVRAMPDAIMEEKRPFLRLAAAQSLLVQQAVRMGKVFHMLMPDHVYSANYFAGLHKVGAKHRNIMHGGINASWPGMAADLDDYRHNGALEIPAPVLVTRGWANTEMCAMNRATPEQMPDEHYHVWRSQDRVLLFNPHANPAYITPDVGRLMDATTPTTGTLDCHTQRLFGTNFYIPTPADDMAFVALSRHEPIPASNFTTLDKFLLRCWAEIQNRPEFLAYYARPTEMVAAIDETAPELGEVIARQQGIVNRMIAKGIRA